MNYEFEINKNNSTEDCFWVFVRSHNGYLNKLGKVSGSACPGQTGPQLIMAKDKQSSWYSSIANAMNSITRYAKKNNIVSYKVTVHNNYNPR